MPVIAKIAAKVALVGLAALALQPNAAQANEKSTFQEALCAGPNCNCISNFICVLQLRINNPKQVHIKLLFSGYEFMQVRQGSQQWEVNNGDVIYVPRSSQGPTSIGIHMCKRGTFGTDCGEGWTPINLNEPTTRDLEGCEDYAAAAVQAAKDNVTFKCGYVGGRWADDYKAHYNACAFAPGSPPILAETEARTRDLATCKNKATTAKVDPPQAKDFNGSWIVTTDKGGAFRFLLTQQGNVVTGQMINDTDSKYSGTLSGNLKPDGEVGFNFDQPGISTSGKGSIWFHPDPNSLIGWVRTDSGTGAALEGKRQ
jgi:hypothetical protein